MHKKLLLVDDSATIQKVFELAFEKSDISVVAVSNGEDAIRMAGQFSPNLVIVDVTLPGRDGFEVAALLAAEESMKGTPMLILSGAFATIDEKKFKACGAKGILLKPFEVSELMGKISGFFEKEEEPPAKTSPVNSAPPDDERWSFSDVLNEAEEKVQAEKPVAAAGPAMESESLQLSGKYEKADLDEFDVSADDIEKPAASSAAEELFTMEEAALSSPDMLEEVEEFEEIGELEERGSPVFMAEASSADEMFMEPSAPFISDAPLEPGADVLEEMLEKTPVEIPESAFAETVAGIPSGVPKEMLEKTPVEIPEKTFAETATRMPVSVPEEILQAELKDKFASRADAIFREVMEKTVEKAMLEMTERLTAEFSAKVRESVEVIAWEVIPATAEALIREEIARIRAQAVKSTPS